MIEQHDLSERRACRLVGLSRDSYRNPPAPDSENVALSAAIIDIAQARRRFGYSLIVSVKLNGIDPQAYLRHVLTHISDYQVNRVADLPPWNVADQFARHPG